MTNIFKNIVLSGVLISIPLQPYWVVCPKTLSEWYKKEFSYQAEESGQDYWKKPEETIKDKTFDCEDITILSQYILKDLRYESYIIVMYNKKSGHAICIFKDKDGLYGFFENQYYNEHLKESSIKDILKKYYSNYNIFYTCTPNKKCKRV